MIAEGEESVEMFKTYFSKVRQINFIESYDIVWHIATLQFTYNVIK